MRAMFGRRAHTNKIKGAALLLMAGAKLFYDGEQPNSRRRAYVVVIRGVVTIQHFESI